MTIMNLRLSPKSAILVSDTQVTHAQSLRVFRELDKVKVFPHLNLMVGGVGVMEPLVGPYLALFGGEISGSLDEVVDACVALLRKAPPPNLPDLSSLWDTAADTLMLVVGHCTKRGRIVAYALMSAHDWEPRLLEDKVYLQPALATAPSTEDWCDIALEQRTSAVDMPAALRANLGGSLMMHELRLWAGVPVFSIQSLGSFPKARSPATFAKGDRASG